MSNGLCLGANEMKGQAGELAGSPAEVRRHRALRLEGAPTLADARGRGQAHWAGRFTVIF